MTDEKTDNRQKDSRQKKKQRDKERNCALTYIKIGKHRGAHPPPIGAKEEAEFSMKKKIKLLKMKKLWRKE